MKKTIILLSILCTALPVFAGDFFGDLFNPDGKEYVYSIGDKQIHYTTDENGKKYVYSIGDKQIHYTTDENGKKYVYSIGDKQIHYTTNEK